MKKPMPPQRYAIEEIEILFPNLFNRLKRLEDNIVGYCLFGATHMLFSEKERAGMPAVTAATFSPDVVRKFETTCDYIYWKRSYRAAECLLPLPPAPMPVEVDFGAVRETFLHAFGDEDALETLCATIAARARDLYRRRFSFAARTRAMREERGS